MLAHMMTLDTLDDKIFRKQEENYAKHGKAPIDLGKALGVITEVKVRVRCSRIATERHLI